MLDARKPFFCGPRAACAARSRRTVRGVGTLTIGHYLCSSEVIQTLKQNRSHKNSEVLPHDDVIVPREVTSARWCGFAHWQSSCRARSLVTIALGCTATCEQVPADAIAAGTPAQVIRYCNVALVARLASKGWSRL